MWKQPVFTYNTYSSQAAEKQQLAVALLLWYDVPVLLEPWYSDLNCEKCGRVNLLSSFRSRVVGIPAARTTQCSYTRSRTLALEHTRTRTYSMLESTRVVVLCCTAAQRSAVAHPHDGWG